MHADCYRQRPPEHVEVIVSGKPNANHFFMFSAGPMHRTRDRCKALRRTVKRGVLCSAPLPVRRSAGNAEQGRCTEQKTSRFGVRCSGPLFGVRGKRRTGGRCTGHKT